MGGGLDAVRLLSEEGDVEVVLQDLLLAELFLDLDRVLQLLDLAADRLLGGLRDLVRVVARLLDEDVLHVLLGEGRRALRGPARLHVAVHRAQDALEVDRPVLVEARVLDRDDRLLHVRGDVLQRDDGAVARVDRGDRAALAVQDGGALAQRRRLEIGRDLVESLDRSLGGEPQSPGGRQRDAREHDSGECGDTEKLGGLLGRGETPPERFFGMGQPTFSFAGQAYMHWPKLLTTVTAVPFRINPRARPGVGPFATRGAPEFAWCVIERPL